MTWIESHVELGEHPKLKRLARRLEVSLPQAVGHLHYLWWWAIRYAPDGSLSGWEPEEIADAAMWTGSTDIFIDSLVSAGFIDTDPIRLHDWEEYGEKLHRRRNANAQRMREKRASEHPDNTCNARAEHVKDTCIARVHDKTGHDMTVQDKTVHSSKKFSKNGNSEENAPTEPVDYSDQCIIDTTKLRPLPANHPDRKWYEGD